VRDNPGMTQPNSTNNSTSKSTNASMAWHRNIVVIAALVLPWINPFTSSPSTNVIPLLLSWMMTACAVLAMTDLPAVEPAMQPLGQLKLGVWLFIMSALLLLIPTHIDHAVTLGLLSALACIGLMVYVGRRLSVEANEAIQYLVTAWLIAAVVNAVIGLLQYLDLTQGLTPWINIPFYKGDAFGNLRQRNQFATLMSIGWMALWWWVVARAKEFQRKDRQLLLCVLTLLLATAAAISISRTGLLQWCVLAFLSLLWCWQQVRAGREVAPVIWWYSAGSLVSFIAASIIMPYIALWVTGSQGASLLLRVAGVTADYQMCAGRGVLWSNVLAMIAQHPWLGWGWAHADLAHFMTPYNGTRFCDMLDNAHDLPLHIALEFGIPFAFLSVLLALSWVWARRPWKETSPSRLLGWGVLLVLAIHSLLEYPLWYGPFQMALGLALGLVWHTSQAQNFFASQQQIKVIQPYVVMPVACLLFLSCLYAAWDFNRVAQIYKAPQARDILYRDDPLGYAQKSWLFKNQADFAWLTTHEVDEENAQQMYETAHRLMSYSPEERVVNRLIASALILGKPQEVDVLKIQLHAMQESLKLQQK
jgi:O-antigen ligase